LKGPEYVAATTRHYRLAIDAAWETREARQQQQEQEQQQQQQQQEEEEQKKKKGTGTKASTKASMADAEGLSPREQLALVFARAQDGSYDGLSAGTVYSIHHTHTVLIEYDGLSAGFLDGPQHQMLVRGRALYSILYTHHTVHSLYTTPYTIHHATLYASLHRCVEEPLAIEGSL
jgi:hypothetical protein